MASTGIDHLRFRPDIEGLRAIAIMLVVAAHAGVPWLAGGFIGVDVFFVLSGFLITAKLCQEATATGHLQLLSFYVRRLRRLLPALLVMLVVTGLASTWILSPDELAQQFIGAQAAALWLSNFHFALSDLDYFTGGSETNLYLHTWSLGVEEQFYLIWPALVVWLMTRGCGGVRGVAGLKRGMLVVAAVSLLACVGLTQTAPLLAFYMMPVRAWQFAAGGLIWLMFVRTSPVTSTAVRAAPALGLLGLMLILFCGLWLDAERAYPGAWAILPTLGALLVVSAGSLPAGHRGAYRVLASPPLQWVGRISYSWYLWHWPVLLLGTALTGSQSPAYRALFVGVSLALASLSHFLVEAPLRRWKQWLAFPRAAVLASVAGMAAIGLLGNYWTGQAERALRSPQLQRYAAARMDAPAIYRMDCDDWYRGSQVKICGFGDTHARKTAVLIGDSHAGQWFPAVRKALDDSGWRLLVITKSSCPMVDAPFFYARIGREYTECTQWRADAIERIREIRPDLLILGSATYAFTRQQWIEGTARVLEPFSAASKRVVLLADTPALPFNGPDCLMRHSLRPEWLQLLGTCSAPSTSEHAANINHWLQVAVARFPNVRLVNMSASICPEGMCRAELDGRVVYRDNQHLSGSFARSLAQPLADALWGAPSLQAVYRSRTTRPAPAANAIQREGH